MSNAITTEDDVSNVDTANLSAPGLGNATNNKARKNTSFKITNILPSRPPSHGPEESGDDDPDDSHTEDISDIADISNVKALCNANSNMRSQFNIVKAEPVATNNPTSSSNPSGNLTITATAGIQSQLPNRHNIALAYPPHGPKDRFKVVKIETSQPVRRGRWQIVDYPEEKDKPKPQDVKEPQQQPHPPAASLPATMIGPYSPNVQGVGAAFTIGPTSEDATDPVPVGDMTHQHRVVGTQPTAGDPESGRLVVPAVVATSATTASINNPADAAVNRPIQSARTVPTNLHNMGSAGVVGSIPANDTLAVQSPTVTYTSQMPSNQVPHQPYMQSQASPPVSSAVSAVATSTVATSVPQQLTNSQSLQQPTMKQPTPQPTPQVRPQDFQPQWPQYAGQHAIGGGQARQPAVVGTAPGANAAVSSIPPSRDPKSVLIGAPSAQPTSQYVETSVRDSQPIASELLVERLEEISTQQGSPDATEDPESASGSNQGAIDNRIEQAMDLVKSHLMNAVRSEVEELKEKIIKLEETISQQQSDHGREIGRLQSENEFLRSHVTPEVIVQLSNIQQQQTIATTALPPPQP